MDMMLKASPYFNPTIYDKSCLLVCGVLVGIVLLGVIIGSSAASSIGTVIAVIAAIGLVGFVVFKTHTQNQILKERPKRMHDVVNNINQAIFIPKQALLAMSGLGSYMTLTMLYVTPQVVASAPMVMAGLPNQANQGMQGINMYQQPMNGMNVYQQPMA